MGQRKRLLRAASRIAGDVAAEFIDARLRNGPPTPAPRGIASPLITAQAFAGEFDAPSPELARLLAELERKGGSR